MTTAPVYVVGPPGPSGPSGDQGLSGEVGPQGLRGIQGVMGPSGPSGSQGPEGEAGPAGPRGFNGYPGPQGGPGPTGPGGPPGVSGLPGPQGIQGVVGPTGPLPSVGDALTVLSTSSQTARTLASRFAEIANILDFKLSGETDFTNALTRALATGLPVIFPFNGGAVYNIASTYSLAANSVVAGTGVGGKPTIKLTGSTSRLFTLSAANIIVQDLIIDGSQVGLTSQRVMQFDGSGAVKGVIRRVTLLNATQGFGFYNGATNNRLEDWEVISGGLHGVVIDGAATGKNVVTHGQVTSCSGFGVLLSNASFENEISFNKTTVNGIELIGITYGCWGNRIIGNHAEGTGDNGISITGYQNVCIGNVCIGNAHSGIHSYGYLNTIVGNFCKNNGQAGGSFWSGINVTPGFGGRAQYNAVNGNVCIDDQVSKTQSYGVQLGQNTYELWIASSTITQTYVYFGANVYVGSAGISGSTPPTHTSGTVSDGNINWTFLYTGPANLGAIFNNAAENVCLGNSVADHADLSLNNNTITGRDHMIRGGASAIRFNVTSNPNGVITGSVGDLAMVVNAAIGMPYVKRSGNVTNTGWAPIAAPLSGNTASRPTASDGTGLQFRNTDTNKTYTSDGTNWYDANGNPSPDLIAFDYNFATGVYRENGSSVSLATHFHIARTSTAYLRSAYPSNIITSFAANNARIDLGGRGLFVGSLNFINYFLNSAAPATQTISLVAGTYYLDIIGSGSATLSGGPTGSATDQNPVAFTLGSTTSVVVTIAGSPAHVNLIGGASAAVASGVLSTQPNETAGSTVTTVAETAYIDISGVSPASGTVIAIWRTPSFVRASGSVLALSATTLNQNEIQLRNNSTGANLIALNQGAGTGSTVFPSVTVPSINSRNCAAFTFNGTATQLSLNGGTTVSATQNQTYTAAAITKILLGTQDGSNNAGEAFLERVLLMTPVVSALTLQNYSQAANWSGI